MPISPGLVRSLLRILLASGVFCFFDSAVSMYGMAPGETSCFALSPVFSVDRARMNGFIGVILNCVTVTLLTVTVVYSTDKTIFHENFEKSEKFGNL